MSHTEGTSSCREIQEARYIRKICYEAYFSALKWWGWRIKFLCLIFCVTALLVTVSCNQQMCMMKTHIHLLIQIS